MNWSFRDQGITDFQLQVPFHHSISQFNLMLLLLFTTDKPSVVQAHATNCPEGEMACTSFRFRMNDCVVLLHSTHNQAHRKN